MTYSVSTTAVVNVRGHAENVAGVLVRVHCGRSWQSIGVRRVPLSRSNMTNSSRPSYTMLQQQVVSSFTACADFMPTTLTYWHFSSDDALSRTTVKSVRLAAHPEMKLAHTAEEGEHLPLLLPFTQKGAPGISVCREEWDTAGIFEVHYYQADSHKQELCFITCAVLKCQVVWGGQITFRVTCDFHGNDTKITRSDCVQAADVFLQFLNTEFSLQSS